MPAYPKHITYRNPRILDAARHAPHCMRCGATQEGQVVGCHSNALEHGKGAGYKAHDLVAYLCTDCHNLIDGRTHPPLPIEERQVIFLEAFYQTMLWLLESGTMRRIA